MGFGAAATNSFTTAIGQRATASALLSTAIGDNAQAVAANSVALGANSIANRPNTVSVGSPGAERIIANVAPGVLGTDAVNVNQLTAVQSQISAVAFGLQQQINQNQKEARQGIAMAMAANGITTPIRPGGTTVGVSGGFFESQGAVGVSVAHRLYALPGAVVFGSYANSGSQSGGRVGASYEF